MKNEFQDLRRRVDEVLKAVIVAAVWLTIVAIVCAVVPAWGAEPGEYEVQISAISCYTDHRFFDDWKTVTTARISLDETNAVLNRSDLEVWSQGLRIDTFPASVESIDISGIEKPSIKLVDRLTLERRTLIKSPIQSAASCSFMPPPDGTAWVWEGDGFKLRQVVTIGPPEKVSIDLQWDMKTFVIENWEVDWR